MRQYCKACKRTTNWKDGIALDNRWRIGVADFPGGPSNKDFDSPDDPEIPRGQTISKTGRAIAVKVIKCEECGGSQRD
jgi:hypothetical protein